MRTSGFQMGFVGLGKMGGNLAEQAAEKGVDVVGYSRATPRAAQLRGLGVRLAPDLPTLIQMLEPPRKIFLSVPAGPVVDEVLATLVPFLEKGDVILDGGNSHFRDSQSRQRNLAGLGIGFVDCGSSGGPEGARTGGCFMVGGERGDVQKVEPLLRALAVPEGFLHAGPPGSGHFVKLVHNAIEFGMLQAIGEGMALLEASSVPVDPASVLHCWAHGSVIRGWLIELMERGLREQPDLSRIPSHVEDTGEVNWAVEEALRLEVPIPVIAQSVMELMSSRDRQKVASRSVSILRHGFGGHPYGEDPAIARERRTGKVGA